MWLTKIIPILQQLYKLVLFLLKLRKGQVNFADIPLNYVSIETMRNENEKEELIIRDINKVNFNEKNKTVTLINDLGTFSFNVDKIKSITLFDNSVYKDSL